MSTVAGTPVIDSPRACVTISFPSTVTRTITALRCAEPIVSRTIFITASAIAGSDDADVDGLCEDSFTESCDVHAANRVNAHASAKIRQVIMIRQWQVQCQSWGECAYGARTSWPTEDVANLASEVDTLVG